MAEQEDRRVPAKGDVAQAYRELDEIDGVRKGAAPAPWSNPWDVPAVDCREKMFESPGGKHVITIEEHDGAPCLGCEPNDAKFISRSPREVWRLAKFARKAMEIFDMIGLDDEEICWSDVLPCGHCPACLAKAARVDFISGGSDGKR